MNFNELHSVADVKQQHLHAASKACAPGSGSSDMPLVAPVHVHTLSLKNDSPGRG
jgi:hypothetical protein